MEVNCITIPRARLSLCGAQTLFKKKFLSMLKKIDLKLPKHLENLKDIKELNNYARESLGELSAVHINSPENAIPHILNFSVVGIKPETLQHALETKEIYVSTQTACSKGGSPSTAVLALTGSEEYASSSLRISISYLTTKEELDYFVVSLKECIESLKLNNE